MSVKHISKSKNLPKGKTNWLKVKSLSEKAIVKAAKSDLDALPLKKRQLAKFRRVNPPQEINVERIRKMLNLSQEEFANYFGISERTLQEWEQGRRKPRGPARTLLKIIEHEPKAVQRALHR